MNLERTIYEAKTSSMLSHINVGYGEDVSILELAHLVKNVVGFEGNITFDINKPNGTPRKLMNSQRINRMGWRAEVSLSNGLHLAYQDFLKSLSK
jgi:GDP-L-fucose synthase